MENINLSAYYDKISGIRAKILSKHRDSTTENTGKYTKDQFFGGKISQYPQKYKTAQISEKRRPLENKPSNEPNVNDRLKQLDSVNERIKNMLASKRQVSTNVPKTNINSYNRPVNTVQHTPKKINNIQSTPKRITSLFQNENKIVESKVGPPLKNWALSRQKICQQLDFKSNNYRNTIQSRLYTGQGSNRQYQDKSTQKKYQNVQVKQQKIIKFDTTFNVLENSFNPRYTQQAQKQASPIKNIKTPTIELPKPKYEHTVQIIKPKVQIANFSTQPSKPSIVVSGFYGKSQTKKLVQLLSQQIELDAKLRQSKQKFEIYRGQEKWKKLKEKIKTFGVAIGDAQIQSWIKISNEECNPFLELTPQASFDFEELAARLVDSWLHWNNKLKESVTIAKLQEEGFKIQEIDLGGKGYITLEDFVCYINLNSDSCLRNRDVFSMFSRWNQSGQKFENSLKYQTFLNFVVM